MVLQIIGIYLEVRVVTCKIYNSMCWIVPELIVQNSERRSEIAGTVPNECTRETEMHRSMRMMEVGEHVDRSPVFFVQGEAHTGL